MAAMRPDKVGDITAGLTATRNCNRFVTARRVEATTQASSHESPVGSRQPGRGAEMPRSQVARHSSSSGKMSEGTATILADKNVCKNITIPITANGCTAVGTTENAKLPRHRLAPAYIVICLEFCKL